MTMRILLDENFPLQLSRRLGGAGYEAEHIIALGLRGLSGRRCRPARRSRLPL